MPNASRKSRRGHGPGANEAEQARLTIIGDAIRVGRLAKLDPMSGRAYTQANFYRQCFKREGDPDPLRPRAGRAFAATSETQRRRFIGDVENGVQRLTPGQSRIIELLLSWPRGQLDRPFTTRAEFERLLALPSVEAPRPVSFEEPPEPPPGRKRRIELRGLRILEAGDEPLPSRTMLTDRIHTALAPTAVEPMRLAVVQGEQGVGKSQLIGEWWRAHGRNVFNRNTLHLDCAQLLGGDEIVKALNSYYLNRATAELTPALAQAINQRPRSLIILDGLSHDDGDDPRTREVAPAVRADRTALSRVRETLSFLADQGARCSVLLGVQTAHPEASVIAVSRRFDASVHFERIAVERLSPDEGALLIRKLGVNRLSDDDLRHLSNRVMGLPISLTAAADYLRLASDERAERFLIDIDSRGSFAFFQEFFGRYLQAINGNTSYDDRAHPHAYLRLLALMPGPVTKSRIDGLLRRGRIRRLERGSTTLFAQMRIAFVVEQGPYVDVNPMVRDMVRQELAEALKREEPSVSTDREELRWIHRTAAQWCVQRLPENPTEFTTLEIEMIEGALYHLLALRDFLPNFADAAGMAPSAGERVELWSTPKQITDYCLDAIVRRYLMDRRTHRATRVLGQFETKARLLSLFFENPAVDGRPRHLSLWDEVELLGEIGVCWMHAGRLHLANFALERAETCLRELGIDAVSAQRRSLPSEDGHDPWRLWTETISTLALIRMRSGRQREDVDDVLALAAESARKRAEAALAEKAPASADERVVLRSLRRLICREGQVLLQAGDLHAAQARYSLALAVEEIAGSGKLSGDALRRYIEVLVRRGPCNRDDLAQAELLIDAQLQPRREARRQRASNDIIPMYATKIMLLRTQGRFDEAEAYLSEAESHPFVRRGECSFTARMELRLERYRLVIVRNAATPEICEEVEALARELQARHHLMLYSDAKLIQAEMEDHATQARILNEVETELLGKEWHLRKQDIRVIREEGNSAVKSLGC